MATESTGMEVRANEGNGSKEHTSLVPALSIFLFGLFVFQVIYHAVVTSATLDEPTHILAGYRHWQCHDFGVNPEHPPLLKLIAAAPLMFKPIVGPPWDCGSKLTTKGDSFLYGAKFVVQNGTDSTVIPARLAASVTSIALAVLVFVAAWKLFGKWEALVAVAVLAFEPNLIANGALVTTDMALTVTAFGAVFAFYRFALEPNWRTFLVAAIALGLMISAKHSALVMLPGLLLALLVDSSFFGTRVRSRLTVTAKRAAVFSFALLAALLMLWSFYAFRYYSIPAVTSETISVADYIAANGRPEMVNSRSAGVVELVDRSRALPESYVLGLADIVATGSRNSYLFNTAYPTGQWFYFPLSFLVKSSVPLLLLLPIGFVSFYFVPEWRRQLLFLGIPPLAFFSIALTSGINIGVRHILPVYPFFIVIAAVGAVWLSRRVREFRYVLAAILFYHAVTAVRTAPDYIPFANDLWGGPDNTYRIYRDPNLDFGQNTKFVLDFLRRRNITDCWYASHGNVELTASQQPCRLLPGTFRLSMSDRIDEPIPSVVEGTVLVTAMAFPPRGGPEFIPFTEAQPVDRIGRSVFVYQGRFEIPGIAALSHVDRSTTLLRLGRVEEALVDAEACVRLAPDDPRTHTALGLALVRVGQFDRAKSEFTLAIETARVNARYRNTELRARQELQRLGERPTQ